MEATPPKSTAVPNVVPLAALRHRKAVQYCFQPCYDADGPVPKPRRVAPPSGWVGTAGVATPCNNNSNDGRTGPLAWTRYPAENYEDDITPGELEFYRSFQSAKIKKPTPKAQGAASDAAQKKRPSTTPAPLNPPTHRKGSVSTQTTHKRRQKKGDTSVADAESDALSTFLCLGTEAPVVELPQKEVDRLAPDPTEAAPLPDGDVNGASSEKPAPEIIRRRMSSIVLSQRRQSASRRRAGRPVLHLEEKDSQRTLVDVPGLHPVLARRLVYIPPPVQGCPSWLPTTAHPSDATAATDTTTTTVTGRFSPNGGFYVRSTMDDEFYSASCGPSVTAHRGSKASEAQQATFRRLSRPNVVAETLTTGDEGRVLKFLAMRRESQSMGSVVLPPPPSSSGVQTATSSPANVSLTPPTDPLRPRVPSGTPTPVRALRVKFSASSPSPEQPPPEAAATNYEALLSVRSQLPYTSRSNGCVGAAEVHYWLAMGQQRAYERDQEACVAQVWMPRNLMEECHSARTVLRNYATNIPRDAVLAVTLRSIAFGHRVADTTMTFGYGDATDDPRLAGVVDTIRTIVKEANSNDGARFRGPFLMCTADKGLCEYLRNYCLGMSSAEHPELAILGFPGAHVAKEL